VSPWLEDVVDIVMRDYRDVVDVYDKVISIEMLEAVGGAVQFESS
jgi:cyclopropane fatty-acyl-phospholipid synthase-like methyltransferase